MQDDASLVIELPKPGEYTDDLGRTFQVEEASIDPSGRDVRGQILTDSGWRRFTTSMVIFNATWKPGIFGLSSESA